MTSRVVILFCLCLTFTPLVHSNNCVVTTVYGCYVDTITPRTIPNQAAASGSQEECAQNCQAIGFTGTAGCENGQDCWCSSASGPLGEKTNNIECYMPCPDSPDQKCGGTSRLTEFSFTCHGSSNYVCSGSTCVVDPSGPYSDPSCGGQCQAPSPPSPPGPPSPSKGGGGTSGGTIILIVFFCSLISYFVVGAIYMKYVAKASGTEIIPNRDFWASLPGLIKDGFVFTTSGFKSGSVSSGGGSINRSGYGRV